MLQTRGSRLVFKLSLAMLVALTLVMAEEAGRRDEDVLATGRTVALGVSTPNLPWNLSSLDAEEAITGKRNAIVNFFWSWDDANYSPDTTLFARIAARGSVPMVTWMPRTTAWGRSSPTSAWPRS
jgi:hypothetical protein